MVLEVIVQYRTLRGKCELGVGLGWDDIERLSAIESTFASSDSTRRFRRESVNLTAVMRGDRIHDRVDVIEIGPGGAVCRNAPYIARGERVELVIEVGDSSYRLRAQGVWLKDDGEDYRVGLEWVGMPVCLHKVALSEHQLDVVDKIAAAA